MKRYPRLGELFCIKISAFNSRYKVKIGKQNTFLQNRSIMNT